MLSALLTMLSRTKACIENTCVKRGVKQQKKKKKKICPMNSKMGYFKLEGVETANQEAIKQIKNAF